MQSIRSPRRRPVAYAVAIVLSATSLVVTHLLEPALARTIFIAFFVSVSATAWIAGTGPAVLAILLAIASVYGAFIAQPRPIVITPAGNVVPLVAFLAVSGFIVTLIHSIRALAMQAQDAREQADTANRAKSQFLTAMSHELRTPLNAIAGYAELLEMGLHGEMTPQQVESVRRIQRSQRHLLRLVEDVLSFAKVEAGKIAMEIVEVKLHAQLEQAMELTASEMRMKNITCTYGGCDPALAVSADGERVQQVVVNLLTNAMKYTAPGGRVTLSVSPNGNEVDVVVRDTGVGIPADQLERIFEPFVQLPQLHSNPSGIGMGLAISRELARTMGGDVTAASEVGVGSTFTLTLPRSQ
jgi:signal transduction histidine kinase